MIIPASPSCSQVFLNQGQGQRFKEATRQVFGPKPMLARVIKVGDVNADGSPDILVGTTYQTQSRLYLGDGSGNFTNVTRTHLPGSKPALAIWNSAMWMAMGIWMWFWPIGVPGVQWKMRADGRCCG
jgi:FG-GAP-like repeat